MKTIILIIGLLFTWSVFAKKYNFDCEELRSLKSSLDRTKDINRINSSEAPGKDAIEYLSAFFEKALNLKTDVEAAKFIYQVNECFARDLPSTDYELALRRADDIKNKTINSPMPEKESLSLVDLTCAGFSIKEILEFMKLRAAGAAAGTKAAVGASVGSTAVAMVSAVVAGLVIGETIKIVDSQTGNYAYKYIGRPLEAHVLEPAVFKAMGVPSKKERLKTEANLLALDVVIAYKENRSKRKSR